MSAIDKLHFAKIESKKHLLLIAIRAVADKFHETVECKITDKFHRLNSSCDAPDNRPGAV